MRTYSRAAAALVLSVALSGAARASEAYSTAIDAYRHGVEAHREGDTATALTAFDYAAEQGVLGAQLKLAKMYAAGDGVERNEGKAFNYYQRVADLYAETSPLHPIARYIADAFVSLGHYYRAGVPAIGLSPDAVRAVGMYRHAASYFGDAAAQYHLARMYLAGEGVRKDAGLAVNWLANATKKHHPPSQALLGDILCHGSDGVRPQPKKGLALLALARQNAGKDDVVWIEALYAQALAGARPADREGADRLFSYWRRQPGKAEDMAVTIAKEGDPLAAPLAEDSTPGAKPVAPPASAPAQPTSGEPAPRPSAAVIEGPRADRRSLGLTTFQNVGADAALAPR